MHRRLIVSATLVLACSTEQPSNPSTDAGTVVSEAGDAGSDASSAALSDAQIVGVLHAINQGEAQEGQLATTSAVRPDVASFASQMVTDHTSADAALTRTSIAPADSSFSLQLQAQASHDLATLRTQTGPAFDQAYVTIQVADHQTALTILDRLLARYVTNAAVSDQIRASRDLVTSHLAHANALQEAMPK
jgi:putative membrane protein